jgi:hypothetical protein
MLSLKNRTIIVAMLLSVSCIAQQRFQEYIYDGINPFNFECHQLHTTSDSGFIFNGFLNSFGGFLLKTDQQGNVQWYKSYSALNNIYDAEQTSDQGYITIGDNIAGKAMLMKVDAVGNVQWTKARTSFGGPAGCVYQLPDGGYIFGGGLPDIFLVRTDAAGNVLWEKNYGFRSDVFTGRFLQPTPDGGFIFCGTLYQPGGIGLVKIDSSGNVQWNKSFLPGDLHGASVRVAGPGYFISGHGIAEHVAMLTDSAGNVVWAKQWPLIHDVPNSREEEPYRVVPDDDELSCIGTHLVSGQTTAHVFRFDTAGNVMWSRNYGTSLTNNALRVGSCRSTYGNGLAFIVHLNVGSGMLVMSLDSTAIANCNDSAAQFSPAPFVVTYGVVSISPQTITSTYNSPALSAAFHNTIVQYECSPLSNDPHFENGNVQAYPNPTDTKITLQFPFAAKKGTLTLLDISGRVVEQVVLENGEKKVEMNTEHFSPGVYLWKYVEHGNVITGKFCVQH